MTETPTLATRLARAIAVAGPMSLGQFMAAANEAYYGSRDPLGAGGDFITAPEISQMFGEIIGLWGADAAQRHGWVNAAYVELGPGRGTLAVDALRAMARAHFTPSAVHFVETSPVLRAAQAAHFPDALWHKDVNTLPTNCPLIIIANEFFDALPIQQAIKGAEGWHRRLVTSMGAADAPLFVPLAGALIPDAVVPETLRDAPAGSIIESSPASLGIGQALAARLCAQGGALLVIDYGYEGPVVGETLQALKGHNFANPFENVGDQDLTAHVDFATLAQAIAAVGGEALTIAPLATQGAWLAAHGLGARAAALMQSARARDRDDQAIAIAEAHTRLTAPEQMGSLFKVLEVVVK